MLIKSPTRITYTSEDVSKYHNTINVVVCVIMIEKEEEEKDESMMSRPEMQVYNRQVTMRQRFTLYEKIATMRNIQQYIFVGDLSMRADCRLANLHHKQSITWKRDIIRQDYVPGTVIKFCTCMKSSCCITYLSYGNEE